jgi:hypothetical protein
MLIWPVFSQETTDRHTPVPSSTVLFEVDTVAISGLLSRLEHSLSKNPEKPNEPCFLDKRLALEYTRFIYQDTDYSTDESYINAVSDFYVKSSLAASQYFLKYHYTIDDIVLNKYLLRYGTNENMQVITLLLNIHFSGGQKEALKINLIKTSSGYKILNLES